MAEAMSFDGARDSIQIRGRRMYLLATRDEVVQMLTLKEGT
jgi:hypothetical protein